MCIIDELVVASSGIKFHFLSNIFQNTFQLDTNSVNFMFYGKTQVFMCVHLQNYKASGKAVEYIITFC